MGVLKTLFWIILGLYALRLLGRLLRPWLQAYARKKTEEMFRQAASRTQTEEPAPKTGEVTIDKKPSRRETSKNKVGEYIEYEEIE